MAEESGPRLGLRARRGQRSPQRAYRLANSIRLPWAVGLVILLLAAVATATLVGQTGDRPLSVPRALLDAQEGVTVATAQSVRRSLNEGVTDLEEFGVVVPAAAVQSESQARSKGQRVRGGREASREPAPNPDQFGAAVRSFAAIHGRYRSVYVRDRSGALIARTGDAPVPAAASPAGAQPAMQDASPEGRQRTPLVLQQAPLARGGALAGTVFARYDTTFLRFPLDVASPGNAWVVNQVGQVVGSLGDRPRMVLLPRGELRDAALRGAAGQVGARSVGGTLERQEIIAWAPVSGFGPAGKPRWAVVTDRSLTSFSLPQTDARRQGLLAGVVVGALTLSVFGWMYIIILRPVAQLQRDAERLAFGDLSRSIQVIRYDELGLVARALERIRVLLIRSKLKERAGSREPS